MKQNAQVWRLYELGKLIEYEGSKAQYESFRSYYHRRAITVLGLYYLTAVCLDHVSKRVQRHHVWAT
jgi:hypothetical protein